MGTRRLVLVTGLACLVEALVLVWFPVFGVRPRLLPPLAALVGTEHGPSGGLPVDCWGDFFPPWQGLPPSKWPCWPWQAEFPGYFSTKRPPFGENGWPAWAS